MRTEVIVSEKKDLPKENLSSYWMTESISGDEVIWDGKKFKGVRTPDFFTEDFPTVPMSGIFWVSRKEPFSTPKTDKDWSSVRFIVSGLPGSKKVPFEREEELIEGLWRGSCSPHIALRRWDKVKDAKDVENALQKLKSMGGNEIVLRLSEVLPEDEIPDTVKDDPKYLYGEARVIEHTLGMGKNEGKLGGLVLELDNGQKFGLGGGLTDWIRTHPPPIDSFVRYKYLVLTNSGLPKTAILVPDQKSMVIAPREISAQ